MAIVLQSAEQAIVNNGIKVVVYGNAGLGKTMLSCTAPKPVVISAEGGLLSLRKSNIEKVFGVNQPGITYDVATIEIKTIEDLIDAFNWAQTPEADYFETICIDSLSEIGEVVLANAKKQVKDARQAYGELIEKMTDTIRKFRDLKGKNVYFAAKQTRQKDEAQGIDLYMPSMPGSRLPQELPYFVDECFCLRTGRAQDGTDFRYLQTSPDFQYQAKDRSGTLEPMEPVNLTHIFNKIKGAV